MHASANDRQQEKLPFSAEISFQPGDIVVALDDRGRVVYWNDAAEQVLGYTRDEVLGLPLDVVCARADGMKHDLGTVLAGTDFAGGFETRRKDGTLVALYMFCTRTRDEQGGVTGVVCVAREVTAFWRAAVSVRASEEKYRQLFATSSDMVVIAGLDGRISEANPAAARLTGYSVEELKGLSLGDLLRPETRADESALLAELCAAPSTGPIVLRCVAERGAGTVLLELMVSLLSVGTERHLLVIGRDVTDRLETLRALRDSEEKYRKVFEAANDAVFLETLDGQILDVNENACRLLGYSRAELLKLTAADLVPASVRAWFPKLRDSLMQTGQFRAEAVNRRKDGTLVPVEASFAVVDVGEEKLVLAIIRDITERKQAETALRENEARLRLVMEQLPAVLWTVDRDLRITSVAGKLNADIVLNATAHSHYHRALRGRTVRYRCAGQGRTFEAVVEPLRDAEARVVGVIGLAQDVTERVAAEQALKESEEKYRNVVERANDGIAIIQDEVVKYVNPRLAQLWGGTESEILGSRFSDHIHPEQLALVAERYRRRMAGEPVPATYETVVVRRDGSPVTVELNVGVITYEGKPAEIVIVRDITERKQAQAALQASEARYRTLVESTRDGVFCVDRQGRFTFVNDVILRRSGRSREWWLGRDHIAVLREEDQPRVRQHFQSVLAGAMVPPTETAYRTATGELLYVELNVAPLYDAQGAVIGAMGISRDITERRRAEQALRESEERLRTLFELFPDGIAVHQDGKVVMVNPAGAKMLGYAHPAELVGRPVMDFIHPDDRALVQSRIRQVLEQGKPGALVEERFRRQDGSYVTVEVTNGPFVWNNRPAVQVVVRDITEKKRLIQKLTEAAAHTQAILEVSPLGISAECDGKIVYANARFANLYGYPLEQIVGMPVERLIAPQDRGRLAEYTKARVAGREAPQHYTFQGLRSDGTTIELEITVGTYTVENRQYTVGFLRPA